MPRSPSGGEVRRFPALSTIQSPQQDGKSLAKDPVMIRAREHHTTTPYRDTNQARFSELLLSRSLVNRHNLDIAIDHSDRQHVSLVDAVADLGFVTEDDSYAALATSSGLRLVDLSELTPSSLALRLVPERVARRHILLPLSEDNRLLTYAISRPFDDDAQRDVAFASGRNPMAVVARRSDLVTALDKYYKHLGDIDLLLARVRSEASIEMVDPGEATARTNSPIIDLCNHIIARAVEAKASDVHIEPTKEGLVVRYRLGGILEPALTLPPESAMTVRNRYKVMARVDISVQHRPQDGAFRLIVNGRAVDIRLSTLPTINGEKIVMRVIDSRTEATGLESLGYDADNLARLTRALDRPDGLVLVTGPTGSGKTTVLYSSLHHLRKDSTNIVTVEDPVERQLDGVNQIPVNNRAGNSFAAVLRSVLRQDPNVIMVGEIRDNEVAQIVGQAAYTGHLVLSSLHTSDAASAITRLLNLGLEPFKVAESLAAIVAQRLVRKLCLECRTVHDAVEAARLGREHGVALVTASAGHGCDRCRNTGYGDRIPVAEVLTPDDQMRDAISHGASAAELRTAMRAAGCRSMREQGLKLVVEGVTSIEEINRVLASEPVHGAKDSDGRRILIVDDDRITRMLVKLLLEREGYEVIEGENGTHAVELAHREHPDLIIIDLMMPEMDGYQAIEKIRRDISLATLPVMVLTAETGPGIEHRVLELGADDYIVKPFDAPVLIARVRAAFRRMQRAAA
jgi:type IV pilus assembly protein PilB